MKKSRKALSEPKTDEERVKQGNSAEAVLSSPIFQEVFEKLEDRFISNWISTAMEEKDKRESQFMSLRVLSDIRLEFESMVNGGKIAARNSK